MPGPACYGRGGEAATVTDAHLVLGHLPPYLLAGGLTPENVREAIGLTGAPAVDVSSGVETKPGEKSTKLIGDFLQAVKTAMETL